MPTMLLKLIPFRDYVYAALAIVAVVWFLHHDYVERSIGAAHEEVAAAAASAKANKEADSKIAQLTATYVQEVAQTEERYENLIRDNDAIHDADIKRLRERAADRGHARQVLESSSSGTSSADARAGSPSALGDVPAEQAQSLADALRADDAALQRCYDDRDSLTGK